MFQRTDHQITDTISEDISCRIEIATAVGMATNQRASEGHITRGGRRMGD